MYFDDVLWRNARGQRASYSVLVRQRFRRFFSELQVVAERLSLASQALGETNGHLGSHVNLNVSGDPWMWRSTIRTFDASSYHHHPYLA